MGSTSGSASTPAPPPEDMDLGLIDLEQAGDFGGWSSLPSLTDWSGAGDTDSEDECTARRVHALLDAILTQEKRSAERPKLDSRTFVRPRRRPSRPALQTLLDGSPTAPTAAHLTYNKYSPAFSLVRPSALLSMRDSRHRTETEEPSGRALSRPIDIDLSQPASSLHTTLTRLSGAGGGCERDGSMLRSGASLLNTSPPSLVSSLVLDGDAPASLMASMTLSILDERDMSTSFLSADADSLPSLDAWRAGGERLTARPRADLFTPRPLADDLYLDKQEKTCVLERNGTFEKESPRHEDESACESEMQRTLTLARHESAELSEITQARHKLSLARSALSPRSPDKPRAPRFEDTPRRDATYKKRSPLSRAPATPSPAAVPAPAAPAPRSDPSDSSPEDADDWRQRCAMAGSSDSNDTATLSSGSPPPPAHPPAPLARLLKSSQTAASTPLASAGATRTRSAGPPPSPHHLSPITPGPAAALDTTTLVRRPARSPPARALPPPPPPTLSLSPGARRSGLPTSKLRQYSSHKELSRLPGAERAARGAAGAAGGILRRAVYASNPALSPTAPCAPASVAAPLQRRDSYTISVEPALQVAGVPPLVRQGTETLRRPQSQLLLGRDPTSLGRAGAPQRCLTTPAASAAVQGGLIRGAGAVSSLAAARVRSLAPPPRVVPATPAEQGRAPAPRPSRLPGPKRALRPPSVYSVAPAGDAEQY